MALARRREFSFLKTAGKGKEDDDGCKETCGDYKRQEVGVFLLKDSHSLGQVRGRTEILEKSSEVLTVFSDTRRCKPGQSRVHKLRLRATSG